MDAITVKLNECSEPGENIRCTVNGDLLIIVVDLTQDLGLSASGKSRAIASSNGFIPLIKGLVGNIWIGKKVRS